MLDIDSRTIRFLSRMGARGVLGQAVYDCIKDGIELYAVTADLSHASGFDRIQRDFPERLINVGIAEQNLIGVAAGLARFNTPVIATSWAMFTSVRVADQVRNYMGYMQSNIKLIGMDSGFIQSGFSYSHTNPPDIAIMRAIPGIEIISPCDGVEIYEVVMNAINHNGPVYIRLTGDATLPIIYKNSEYRFEIGKANVLRQGGDVAIIATGNCVSEALIAANMLDGFVNCAVIDLHTIRPLDYEMLNKLKGYRLIVTVEEHLISGGLGGAVAEYYSMCETKPRQIILGVNNCYPASGDYQFVCEQCGISANQIYNRILDEFSKDKSGG